MNAMMQRARRSRKLARRVSILAVLMMALAIRGGVQAQVLATDPPPPRPTPGSADRGGSESPKAVIGGTAAELASAMDISPGDVLARDLMGSDSAGVGVGNAPLGTWFPTQGSSFAILSTGLAGDADRANLEESLSWVLGGLNNNQENDLVRLHLQLAVPAEANCLGFDFIFYSEEFFEWVGTIYTDAFTIQLNNASISVSGTTVVAPGNFVTDPDGNFITVNAAYLATSNTGTTYDGATPLLQATTPVTPGSTIDLYFSIQDHRDDFFDSAVFLDNFAWSNDPSCTSSVIPITFLDVPTSHWAWRFIEGIAAAGLTSGFPDGTYKPENLVTRAEMAVFIKKGIHGGGYSPPAPDGSHPFGDISGHWAEAWIEDLFDEGFTSGFPDGTYRPDNQVTRAEMAVFLKKAIHGSSYTSPMPDGSHPFSDIAGHWAEAWIEDLFDEGITSGFPDGTYRPENTATRAEMAVFLVNAFSLPLP